MPFNPTGVLDLPISEAERIAPRLADALSAVPHVFHHPADPTLSALERAHVHAALGIACGWWQRANGVPLTVTLDADGWEVTRTTAALAPVESPERVFEVVGRLAAEWVQILDTGQAVGVGKIELAANVSDELRAEHGRRVLSTAAAVPLAIEIASIASRRPLQLTFPIDLGDGQPGYGIKYADGGAA